MQVKIPVLSANQILGYPKEVIKLKKKMKKKKEVD